MKRLPAKTQRGFTLIELMIVITILGILMAVAVPAYQNYSKRARIAEGLGLAAAAKSAVHAYVVAKNSWPADNTAAGLADPGSPGSIRGESVAAIQIASGIITITYNDTVAPNKPTLILSGSLNAGSIQWTCKRGTLAAQYTPSSCNH